MDILLSVQPKYVDEILSGKKQFEYRTLAPKEEIDRTFIYSSSPVKRIVASFDPDFITPKGTAEEVWNMIKNCPGADKLQLESYFKNRKGVAIHISDLVKLSKPIDPNELFPGFRAPQSFTYCKLSKLIPK
jgi:type I restriction enzyme S subunit